MEGQNTLTGQAGNASEVPVQAQASNVTSAAEERDWTEQLTYSAEQRPKVGRQPSKLKEMLLQTLTGGAVRVPENSLPIKVKSLRTQVVAIAKQAKAISHVIARDGVVSMWLEPRPAVAHKRVAKPATAKTAGRRKGSRANA